MLFSGKKTIERSNPPASVSFPKASHEAREAQAFPPAPSENMWRGRLARVLVSSATAARVCPKAAVVENSIHYRHEPAGEDN